MSTAVLLADPEPTARGYLERHLADDGFEVVGGDALELTQYGEPDLLLLDASALELVRRIRDGELGRWRRDIPVIVLGRTDADVVDRVRAFDRGCDDYLPRPFVYEELLARIRALLRRVTPPDDDERMAAGGIVVDRATRRVTVCGERVALAGKEYELLLKLMSDPLRVFPKERLLREVWGFRSAGRTRTLDSHASRLRRKLARDGAGPFVVNVWGVGYRLLDG
jgi:DNA-binding response OmpR family regulator